MSAGSADPATGYREAGYRAAGLWTDATLADLVPAAAARHPDRELFCFEGERLTYGGFEVWTRAIALDLVRRGVRPRDRVLVQLPNRLEALATQVAAFRAGAVDVPVVPIYRTHEMRQILADCRPAAVCAPASLGERARAAELDGLLAELGQHLVVRYLVGGERPGWSALPGRDDAPPDPAVELPEPLSADEPVLLLYTSGTTSAPKGALLSSRAVFAHLVNFAGALGAGEHTVTLAATPLSHLSGFVASVVFPAFLGGRSVVMPAWRPDEAVELIARERVNLMMGATVFIADLVQRYERGGGTDGGPGTGDCCPAWRSRWWTTTASRCRRGPSATCASAARNCSPPTPIPRSPPRSSNRTAGSTPVTSAGWTPTAGCRWPGGPRTS